MLTGLGGAGEVPRRRTGYGGRCVNRARAGLGPGGAGRGWRDAGAGA